MYSHICRSSQCAIPHLTTTMAPHTHCPAAHGIILYNAQCPLTARMALCASPRVLLLRCATIILFSLRTPLGMLLWGATIAVGLSLPKLGPQYFGAPSREPRTAFNYGGGRFDAD